MVRPEYEEVQYGFRFGAATVTRCCSDERKGWVILMLETPKNKGNKHIQIYVTKTGKVRIHSRENDKPVEWKPEKKEPAKSKRVTG